MHDDHSQSGSDGRTDASFVSAKVSAHQTDAYADAQSSSLRAILHLPVVLQRAASYLDPT